MAIPDLLLLCVHVGSRATIAQFVDGGTLQLIFDLMQRHSGHSTVQGWACAALKAFAWDPSVREGIGAVGGVAIVFTAALAPHTQNPDVVLEACGFLFNMACCASNIPLINAHVHVLRQCKQSGNAEIVRAVNTVESRL